MRNNSLGLTVKKKAKAPKNEKNNEIVPYEEKNDSIVAPVNNTILESGTYVPDVNSYMEQWEAYRELIKKVVDDSDYQNIKTKDGDKKFMKKSGFRKLAAAFNVGTRVIDKKITYNGNGKVIEAEFIIEAWLPNGRKMEGWGSCSANERGFTKPNHDIPATAMTRATNRAISDLIGVGEVSAEEMQGAIIDVEGSVKK